MFGRLPAHHKGGGTEAMEDGYWGLFWETGAPEFYMLQKRGGGAESSRQA